MKTMNDKNGIPIKIGDDVYIDNDPCHVYKVQDFLRDKLYITRNYPTKIVDYCYGHQSQKVITTSSLR